MAEIYKYKTITSITTAEFKDRGSKFIAYAYPIATTDDVKSKLQLLKKEHPKAVHHCYAYRIGTDGVSFRANDDGEPSGSAGKPILGQIDSAELTNVLVVVVRYFGGTLLGVPGLINAYKTATADALMQAVVTEKWIEQPVEVQFDYPVMGEVMYLLRQSEATIYKQDLQLFCMVEAGIPKPHADAYIEKLSEIRGVTVKKKQV
ncbi:MAG: YigZ family protein [Bacteroidetes bacterium 43-93]|nr:YigZ family protein [Bacteroidota bacterium]OJX01165.1 MAG: YigZ family protein [Bacteroidetes bacterium 43-93]